MANTPNLDLVKPAGTDHALVSVINSNSDKIDGGFGTLSEQIAKKVGYDIVDIYTGNVLEASAGLYRCPSAAQNLPIASNGYLTVITRSTNLTLLQFVADNGRMFINVRNSSSWTGWEELAIKSGTNMARTAVSITSDTAIIDWEPGTYTINDATAATNGYVPSRYGSIVINKADGLYGSCFFVTTNGSTVFVRSFHKSNKTWYTGWQQLASNSESITFTPESGVTNHLFIRKSGRVVTVNGYLEKSTAFSDTVENIGTISVGNRPAAAVRFIVAISNAAYNVGDMGYGVLGSDGILAIKAKSGNTYKTCYFSASYIVES